MATTIRVSDDRNMEDVIQNLITAVEAAHADGTNVIHLLLPSYDLQRNPDEVTVTVNVAVQLFRSMIAPIANEIVQNAYDAGQKLGVIVMTEYKTLFGTSTKTGSEILRETEAAALHKMSMFDMCPSDKRSGRREHYAEDIARMASNYYINSVTGLTNIAGLVLAGTADFSALLFESHMLDPRVKAAVLKVANLSPEGASGLEQAMHEIMSNVAG